MSIPEYSLCITCQSPKKTPLEKGRLAHRKSPKKKGSKKRVEESPISRNGHYRQNHETHSVFSAFFSLVDSLASNRAYNMHTGARSQQLIPSISCSSANKLKKSDPREIFKPQNQLFIGIIRSSIRELPLEGHQGDRPFSAIYEVEPKRCHTPPCPLVNHMHKKQRNSEIAKQQSAILGRYL